MFSVELQSCHSGTPKIIAQRIGLPTTAQFRVHFTSREHEFNFQGAESVVDQVHVCHLQEDGNTGVTTFAKHRNTIFMFESIIQSSTFQKNGAWPQRIMQMCNLIQRVHATTLQIIR